MSWCMRYWVVSIRTTESPCASITRSISVTPRPSPAALSKPKQHTQTTVCSIIMQYLATDNPMAPQSKTAETDCRVCSIIMQYHVSNSTTNQNSTHTVQRVALSCNIMWSVIPQTHKPKQHAYCTVCSIIIQYHVINNPTDPQTK